MAPPEHHINALLSLLAKGPISRSQAAQALGVSQPTFSRLWQRVNNGVMMGAARSRQYGLGRSIAGVELPIPVFVISTLGQASLIGSLQPLQGGWWVQSAVENHDYALFQGMPFFLQDLRPQGFLGRIEPLRNPDLALPDDIRLWSDEYVLLFLSRRSEHAAGNIVIGNESYSRFLTTLRANHATAPADRERVYPVLADSAMRGDPPGSSAGGEQPKFTHMIQYGEAPSQFEHVIVKFSPRVDSASGQRWADLLLCEHLALNVLLKNNIPAARTTMIESAQRVFLEVSRFDRVGRHGRLPMVTLAGLDGMLGMLDQNWTAVARELVRQGLLSTADQQTVEILDLYGALIGNTDKHHGNIALSWASKAPYRLLPSYDMLPMLYRPSAHGEIIPRTWDVASTKRLDLRHLPLCFSMAQQFWHAVLNEARISIDFKQVATHHLAAIEQLNPQPLAEG